MALVRTDDKVDLSTKHQKSNIQMNHESATLQNYPISSFLGRINSLYRSGGKYIVDKSGINTNVDIHIQADMGNLEQLNQELGKYGLTIIESVEEIDFLIISDANPSL